MLGLGLLELLANSSQTTLPKHLVTQLRQQADKSGKSEKKTRDDPYFTELFFAPSKIVDLQANRRRFVAMESKNT